MQTRRHFITSLLAAGAAPRLHALADLDALSPIEKVMREFVMQRMMDDDGLCRSMLCAATLKPWTNADLAKVDQRRIIDMFQNAPDKAGCMTYENALMATSEFALSQIVRHRVTKNDRSIAEVSITSWLVAYWRLREAAARTK